MQRFCSFDRRTVTPEVAGSSPVAPVSHRESDRDNLPQIRMIQPARADDLRLVSKLNRGRMRRREALRDEQR